MTPIAWLLTLLALSVRACDPAPVEAPALTLEAIDARDAAEPTAPPPSPRFTLADHDCMMDGQRGHWSRHLVALDGEAPGQVVVWEFAEPGIFAEGRDVGEALREVRRIWRSAEGRDVGEALREVRRIWPIARNWPVEVRVGGVWGRESESP